MPSNYPGSLDAFTTGTLTGVVSGSDHGNKGDAINKIEAAVGAGVTNGRLKVVQEAPLNPKWPEFGAVWDGVADDTTAIQACLDAAKTGANNGRGQMLLPPGSGLVSALTLDYTSGSGSMIDIIGTGKRNSFLVKKSGTSTPVLKIDGGTVIELDIALRDFAIRGNAKGGNGLELEALCRAEFTNLDIRDCDRGIDNDGSLIWWGRGLTLSANNTGIYAVTGAGSTPNMIGLSDCLFYANTSRGMLFDEGGGLKLDHCTFEFNGTAGGGAGLNTGGLYIESSMPSYGFVSVDTCWFESNNGRALQAYSGILSIDSSGFLTNESGRDVYLTALQRVSFRDSWANGTVQIDSTAPKWLKENCEFTTFTTTSKRGRTVGMGYDTAASTGALTLPEADVVSVTGSTTVTSITAGEAGRRVFLIWAAGATFDVTDGSNLKLASSITAHDADDTLTLVSDGTNWFETGRSVN